MPKTLTEQQAYLAMFFFLEQHWRRCSSDDIGALLGSLSLLPNGTPADPAFAGDWDAAVNSALSGKVDARMSLEK